MDDIAEIEGDEKHIGGRKEDTEGNLPFLSDANMATAATVIQQSDGNFTIDCIILVKYVLFGQRSQNCYSLRIYISATERQKIINCNSACLDGLLLYD